MYVPSWFPGAGFRRKAKLWREWAVGMVENPYRVAKQKIVSYIPFKLPFMCRVSVERRFLFL